MKNHFSCFYVKSFSISILLILPIVLFSCATYPARTDASNYRSKLEIEKEDYSFFNGQYTGAEKDCFPPPNKRICKTLGFPNQYKSTKGLNIELFHISLKDFASSTTQEVKELAHLVASELAVQRGFSIFTITRVSEFSNCATSYTANTYGSLNNKTYRGSTYIKENVVCANRYSIEVLLFNNQEEIDQGVLYHINSGISADKSDHIYPFKSLYIGTIPGELDTSASSISRGWSFVPTNAWKTHYKAKELAEALRNKYKIDEKETYSFIDKKENNKQQAIEKEADLLEKYKITK